ncbi:MAG: hypothetical protein JNJ83_11055 [Verrucomicrobiaceae bacterium]|nr:hypothetical protein [Verrucomicrobiaceae bacterium]
MDWPDQNRVLELIASGGLSGAEYEVLDEYLGQPVREWEEDFDAEAAEAEMANDSDVDPCDPDFCVRRPVYAFLKRLCDIGQNRGGVF